MPVNFASAPPPLEWLPLTVVERMIHNRTAAERDDVLARCRDGRIRSRVVNGALQVADDALFNFIDSLPPAQPAPEVFVKVGGKVFREIPTSRGTLLRRV